MQRQRGELVPIGDALADLGGPVNALRETSPQARHHFTRADQVNRLVRASEADLCYAAMRELHREIKKDQKDQRWAFWWFVLMAGIVAVVGGFLGNFLREGAVRALDALGAWWGS